MFLQNFFSWHYFGNLLCFSNSRHHSTILQIKQKFMPLKIRLIFSIAFRTRPFCRTSDSDLRNRDFPTPWPIVISRPNSKANGLAMLKHLFSLFWAQKLSNIRTVGTWMLYHTVRQCISHRLYKAMHTHMHLRSGVLGGRMNRMGAKLSKRAIAEPD
jgi:hypothetical protein